MSRKTTAALLAALGINFALAGGALMLANLNKPAEFDVDAAFAANASDLSEVAGIAVDASAGDLAVPLKAAQQGGSTRVTFTCGKKLPTGREVHEGTWDAITGAVLYNPETQSLLSIEVTFDTRSLRTDDSRLTKAVTENEKWFDVEKHPLATFTCVDIKPTPNAATTSTLYLLAGTFTLNGISKPIEIPVNLDFAGQGITIDGAFSLLRSDFDVDKRASSLAGTAGGIVSEVEDEVALRVRVTASPDLGSTIAELAGIVEQQQEALRIAGNRLDRLDSMARRIDLLEEAIDRIASGSPRVKSIPGQTDLASFSKTYTDRLPAIGKTEPFEMVLVPGDNKQGIAPLYMSTHEVSWRMLRHWMEGFEVSATEGARRIDAGLQPSIVFGVPSTIIKIGARDCPAMGMTQLTAKAYCKWLSENTGRRYRLPTIQEWQHALALGGGVPDDIDAVAWHAQNSPLDDVSLSPTTSDVGKKVPNTLGLYDMLGGVAEWVTNTGEDRVVVGGSIFTEPEDITADWRAVEDLDIWAASHPQLPKSRYWYNDFYVTGIRLVCEPASVVANPPKAADE